MDFSRVADNLEVVQIRNELYIYKLKHCITKKNRRIVHGFPSCAVRQTQRGGLWILKVLLASDDYVLRL